MDVHGQQKTPAKAGVRCNFVATCLSRSNSFVQIQRIQIVICGLEAFDEGFFAFA